MGAALIYDPARLREAERLAVFDVFPFRWIDDDRVQTPKRT
jgi:hypothetical protein